MKRMSVAIEGMHCDGCAETIKALLSLETGVEAVTVSYQEGRARRGGGASQRRRLRLRFFSRPGSSGAFANLSLRTFRGITPVRYTAAQSTNGAAAT